MDTCEICHRDVGARHVVTLAGNVLHQSCYRACTKQLSPGVTHIVEWLSFPASVMIRLEEEEEKEDPVFYVTSLDQANNIFGCLSTGTEWVVWLHRTGMVLHGMSGDVTASSRHDTNYFCEWCKRIHDARDKANVSALAGTVTE